MYIYIYTYLFKASGLGLEGNKEYCGVGLI